MLVRASDFPQQNPFCKQAPYCIANFRCETWGPNVNLEYQPFLTFVVHFHIPWCFLSSSLENSFCAEGHGSCHFLWEKLKLIQYKINATQNLSNQFIVHRFHILARTKDTFLLTWNWLDLNQRNDNFSLSISKAELFSAQIDSNIPTWQTTFLAPCFL